MRFHEIFLWNIQVFINYYDRSQIWKMYLLNKGDENGIVSSELISTQCELLIALFVQCIQMIDPKIHQTKIAVTKIWLSLQSRSSAHMKVDSKLYNRLLPKICDWAKYQNRHSSKSISVTKLSFCQSDSPMSESFWQKNSLVTHIFFVYAF